MADVHKVDLSGFAGLTHCEMAELLEDGRFASAIITRLVPKWYPALKRTGELYATYRDSSDNPYLLRMFTNGLKFMPSRQLGTGRKFDIRDTLDKGESLTVICAGLAASSQIWTSFIPFTKLIEEYPLAIVPDSDKKYIQDLHG